MLPLKFKLYIMFAWPVLLLFGMGLLNAPLLLISMVCWVYSLYIRWEWTGTSSLPWRVISIHRIKFGVLPILMFLAVPGAGYRVYKARLAGKDIEVTLVARGNLFGETRVRLVKIDNLIYYAKPVHCITL